MDTTLKALRYFVAAIECGSITEASKRMHVVPSAVLSAINQVEEAFGLQLTIRYRSKGIALTATGQALLTRIQNLLDEYETLMSDGADMRTRLTGTLRVGYYTPVAPAFMPGIVSKLRQQSASIDIKFTECDNRSAQAGLLSGAFDVILCVAESMTPEISYETLTDVPAYILAAKDHSFAHRRSISLAELADENVVLLDLPVISEYYGRLFSEAGIKPTTVATATTVEMVRSLVGAGVGCSLLHMRPRAATTYSGDVVVGIPLDPPVAPLKIVLGHLPDNPRRLVKEFVDQLRDFFANSDSRQLLVPLQEAP